MRNLIFLFLLTVGTLNAQTSVITEMGHTLSNDFGQGIYTQIGVSTVVMQDNHFGIYVSPRVGYMSTYSTEYSKARYFTGELVGGITNNKSLYAGIKAGYANNLSVELGTNEFSNFGYMGIEFGALIPFKTILFTASINPNFTSKREFLGKAGIGVIIKL